MSNMNEYTYYEDGDRKYRIGAFTPSTGLYLSSKLSLIAAPVMINLISGAAQERDIDFASVVKVFDRATYDEFFNACSQVIYVEMPAGYVPLFNANGSTAIPVSIALMLKLMIETLKFNFSDFFAELLPLISEKLEAIQSTEDMTR